MERAPGSGGEEHGDRAHPSIVDCGAYGVGGRVPGVVPLDRAGDVARAAAGEEFVWIGIHDPDPADVAAVAAEFGLPPLAVEDAVKAHQRPKLEVYDDVIFVVIKPVAYVGFSELEVSEIALFIGSGFVVSVRHGASDVLGVVRRKVDAMSTALDQGPVSILHEALDAVVDQYESVIETLGSDIDDLEGRVFGADDANHAESIYQLKRDAAQIRRAMLPLGSPLLRLAQGEVPGIPGGKAAHYFRDVYDHYVRSSEALDGGDRMLTDVLQADLARVSVRQADIALRQNEDMRKISAWAAIALVPTAIGGIYGMNFEHMPELGWRYSYALALATIAAGCVLLFLQFRKRGWL